MTESESNKSINNYLYNDEINFADVFKFFKRNYKFISIFTFLTILISIFHSLRIKPTWIGEFQIVLASQKKQQSRFERLFGGASFLSGLGSNDIDTGTEVEILKSPLVMKPVFNLYKELNKEDNGEIKKYIYKDWIKSKFDIELVEETVVLNIKYKDKNKQNIIPILTSVSNQYQNYSGRERDISLINSIAYVNDQIKKKKEENKNSLQELQKFSLENNLGGLDGMIPMNLSDDSDNPIDMDKIYMSASERYSSHRQLLDGLEAELIEKSTFYKPNSVPIVTLKKKIETLKDSLKRPSEILLRYRELSRQAIIDETALLNLERQKSFLEIKKLETTKPWDVITSPILQETQFAPNKTSIVQFWATVGFILSTIFASINEFKTGRIFSKFRLKKIIPFKLLKSFKYEKYSFNSEELDILSATCFSNKNKTHNLITLVDKCNTKRDQSIKRELIFQRLANFSDPLNNVINEFAQKVKGNSRATSIVKANIKKLKNAMENDKNHNDAYKQFLNELKNKDDSCKLELITDLSKVKSNDVNYILIKEGSTNFQQLSNFLDDISLSKIKISGWFFLSD